MAAFLVLLVGTVAVLGLIAAAVRLRHRGDPRQEVTKAKDHYERANSWLHGNRAVWIAPFLTLAALAGAALVAIMSTRPAWVPAWSVAVLGAGAAAAFYAAFAAVFHWRPFVKPVEPSEVIGELSSALFILWLAVINLEYVEENRGLPAIAALQAVKLQDLKERSWELHEKVRVLLGNPDAALLNGCEVPPKPGWVRPEIEHEWRLAMSYIAWTRTRIHDYQVVVGPHATPFYRGRK
jgi:hypothetical protein